VFGLTDWYRDGTLAEYVAVEARNLTPLPGDVDFTVGAVLGAQRDMGPVATGSARP
jgi:NADPH:quinone reductase-like Zn-dependent oxidoreductase